jgi:poly-beta-1,6-N-acetyl-D-glucosamine synthase
LAVPTTPASPLAATSRPFDHSWDEPTAPAETPVELGPEAEPPVPRRRIRLSVVTCAYNEGRNLPHFLPAVLESSGPSFELLELIAVASGCTDDTVGLLQATARADPRVRVVVQAEKKGKAAAMAAGLAAARGDVILFANADTRPRRGALEALAAPFFDPEVTLVTSHPVPAIDTETMTAQVARVLWEVHDRVSEITPKAGEAFAIRRMRIPLSNDVEDDDTFIGIYAAAQGGRSVYAREAVVYNRVPSFPSELLRQRIRINRQVLGLYRRTGFSSSTWSPGTMMKALVAYARENPRRLPRVVMLLGLEGSARALALGASLVSKRPLQSWSPIDSTKLAIDG